MKKRKRKPARIDRPTSVRLLPRDRVMLDDVLRLMADETRYGALSRHSVLLLAARNGLWALRRRYRARRVAV